MTRRPVTPAVAAALLGVGISPHDIGPIARIRPARVIKLGFDPSRATTTPLPEFDRDAAASAWIAEMRAKQAVR